MPRVRTRQRFVAICVRRHTALRFADQTVAHKAITALKRMVARKGAKAKTEAEAG
jgi:hypothetical protein